MTRILQTVFALSFTAAALCGCGGSKDSTSSSSGSGGVVSIDAGTFVWVPSGAAVSLASGGSAVINGQGITVYVPAGTLITTPTNSTGPNTNLVATTTTTSSGLSSSRFGVSVIAGSTTPTAAAVDGSGSGASFWAGGQMAINASGNILFADGGYLRQVTPAGAVTTLSQSGQPYVWGGVASDAAGNIYGVQTLAVSSSAWGASFVKLNSAGASQTLLGNWAVAADSTVGFGGLVVDSKGNLFLADGLYNRIVKYTPGGTWSVFAGSGASGNVDGTGTAASFSFNALSGLAIDSSDNLYVRSGTTIRKINASGVATTLATQLTDTGSFAIAVDPQGTVYAAGLKTLYRVTSTGTVSTYAFTDASEFIASMASNSAGVVYASTKGVTTRVYKFTF